MRYTRTRRGGGRAWLAVIAAVATMVTALPAASADSQAGGSHRIVVCLGGDVGGWKRIQVAPSAVPAHVSRGGVVAGDPVSAASDRVFDQDCRPVFSYAELVRDAVNEVRRNIDPPCDPAAPDTPCGPENGGLLPPVSWNQDLADLASTVADTCPVFDPRDENTEAVHRNVYFHFSQTPVTEEELVALAVATWANRSLSYDPVTGTSLRPGDLSTQIYSSMLWADEVGMSANASCPNNRAVVVMYMTPGHGEGPAYPPLFDD